MKLVERFAPMVVRYVELMEHSITQSIERGFAKEKWEIRKYVFLLLCPFRQLQSTRLQRCDIVSYVVSASLWLLSKVCQRFKAAVRHSPSCCLQFSGAE